MQGSYFIQITSPKVQYNFTLNRKYTIIKGDSGTGKTTLYSCVREAWLGSSTVKVACSRQCIPAIALAYNWEQNLLDVENSIIFIDEDLNWVITEKFARVAKQSKNYFVIIHRKPLEQLPYSVKEVYKIVTQGKKHSLEPIYKTNQLHAAPDYIMTEDSRSGYQFFNRLFRNCVAAAGKSEIVKKLETPPYCNSQVLVVADGAAFGSNIESIVALKNYYEQKIKLFLPESFELMLLKSCLFKQDERVQSMLRNLPFSIPADCESWEQFFTQFLNEVTKDTPAAYGKSKIKDCYLLPCYPNKKCRLWTWEDKVQSVLNQIKGVDFSKIRK